MPLRFWWQPTTKPKNDLFDIGLDLGGNNDKSPMPITGPTAGRIRLLEVGGKGDSDTAERLLCRFHGTFFHDAARTKDERIRFRITVGKATSALPHLQDVVGFDPECMHGIDAFVLTFLNREFVIFLPFMVDSGGEGDFLEIVAVAELGPIASATEIGRSSVLNLRIRRGKHTVNSTSNTAAGPLQYTNQVIGNRIAHHESFLFRGASWKGQLPSIVFPAPIPAASANLTFSPYIASSMQVLFTPDLPTLMMPEDAFLAAAIPKQNLVPHKARLLQQIRSQLGATLVSIFTDAGFAGVRAFWSDEPSGNALFSEFRAQFVPPSMGNRTWHLGDPDRPLAAPFWHFYVTGASSLPEGVAAAENFDLVHSPRKTVKGTTYIVPISDPIGSGTKSLIDTIRINPQPFVEGVTTDKNGQRRYKDRASFDKALAAMATQVAIVAAHEIGHSLGLMHLFLVTNGTYSEPGGGSVLTIMSQTVEQGALALNMKFHRQAKYLWSRSFGVSPTMADTTLRNKTWTDAEVNTLTWGDRRMRFFLKNQVSMLRSPSLTSGKNPPTYARFPAPLQKGTEP